MTMQYPIKCRSLLNIGFMTLALLTASTTAEALSLTLPEAPPKTHGESGDIELSGIVLDRTITRFGKDFFFYYTSYWRDIPETDGLTVVIHEQVFPQAGTRLWVEMEQETIFQTYFGRRHTDTKKVAEQAILISLDKVVEIKAGAAADSILEQLK